MSFEDRCTGRTVRLLSEPLVRAERTALSGGRVRVGLEVNRPALEALGDGAGYAGNSTGATQVELDDEDGSARTEVTFTVVSGARSTVQLTYVVEVIGRGIPVVTLGQISGRCN